MSPAQAAEQPDDLLTPEQSDAELERLREERFAARKKAMDEDPTLDPRLKALYLDRTILTSKEAAQLLSVTPSRISTFRKRGTGTHPLIFPTQDVILGSHSGQPRFGVEAGRVREWAVQSERLAWNTETGQLDKKTPSRHGRSNLAQPGTKPHSTRERRRKLQPQ